MLLTMMQMKRNVLAKYGANSEQFGWFMWNYSRRSEERTREVYRDLMGGDK